MTRPETIRQATRATRLAYARALLARIEARLGLRPMPRSISLYSAPLRADPETAGRRARRNGGADVPPAARKAS